MIKFKVIAENGAEKELEISNSTLKELRLFLEENQKQEDVFDIDYTTNGFYYITSKGCIDFNTLYGVEDDDSKLLSVANACKDKELMEKRALNETLNRLMWRFSMQNGGREIDWEDLNSSKWSIDYDVDSTNFYLKYTRIYKNLSNIHFKDQETAIRCIEEVVKPFLAEHPDFEPNVY